MGRTVLIDADILAFQIASSQEEVYQFGDQMTYHADLDQGIREVDNALSWILDHTDSDQAALFLTGTKNFREGRPSHLQGQPKRQPPSNDPTRYSPVYAGHLQAVLHGGQLGR